MQSKKVGASVRPDLFLCSGARHKTLAELELGGLLWLWGEVDGFKRSERCRL